MKTIKEYNLPIYNYLRKYAKEDINVFHMPGHKLSRGIPRELSDDVLKLDVTEIDGTDNLHYPEGIIKEAQELAARAFGADRTFFLVNGSTCGIQAAIMSVCTRGQKIIIGRDSHKSVVSGLILSGAKPIFVYPEYNSKFGIHEGITAQSIENALSMNPDAAAVLITRPNYYGICSDIKNIADTVHSYGKPLIVDEAHGAHLSFSPLLPPSANQYNADVVIQSAHKTLPAVTQGAYLHLNGPLIDIDKILFNLAMLQTSSPSYIVMTYLDIARELMQTEGIQRLKYLLDEINIFNGRVSEIGGYKVLSGKYLGINTIQDPTRLVLNVSRLGISGFQAEATLRAELSTQVEMADYENIVLITTIADKRRSFERLYESLSKLAQIPFDKDCIQQMEKKREFGEIQKPSDGFSVLSPYEAYAAQKEQKELKSCLGRICAGVITPYPPGIPILYPGEIIDGEKISYIEYIIDLGGTVNGVGNNNSVQVVK
ncbi:aminotransferase class I/II-fold pyridoxal phosphate-dependent enzyme [Ruminiclostridium cellulolyticum]|uniref:Orn/Lys/Arg decarboxylase major region n=1 Tax=Ruminiclostridium cellulolyticum (strain ATCC 35319 / DSM 5812 / JCM 6584 / H10) TaxID=394503 RepID=B8I4I9_RUMCH|nr:aminotransferase class I/II-fold pyridoxal phosphate-dependent enzyme [Ruminiclostridium cellulolyticum]ACL74543.1 Orn/Lys/Arg decarboxylase major region [Ruminiclostridium cellulolyticum H10]